MMMSSANRYHQRHQFLYRQLLGSQTRLWAILDLGVQQAQVVPQCLALVLETDTQEAFDGFEIGRSAWFRREANYG